jgi:hypothetical protein
VHIIKLRNPIRKKEILKKIVILIDFESVSKFKSSKNLISGNPLKLRTSAIFK